jgi:hypothetical protein
MFWSCNEPVEHSQEEQNMESVAFFCDRLLKEKRRNTNGLITLL